jgi:hypothetical protein
MNWEDWYPFCLEEIDNCVARGKRLLPKDVNFLKTARPAIEKKIGLSTAQEKWLLDIHNRVTEIGRVRL